MAYLFKKRSREFYLLAAITILSILFSFILWQKLSFIQHSHFSDLAFSFLQGQLSLSEPLRYTSWQDSAAFGDKFYVYFGPVPSLLLLPLKLYTKAYHFWLLVTVSHSRSAMAWPRITSLPVTGSLPTALLPRIV
ncbi:MAG: hypothetical protein UV41_C0064G0008 [Candidatus Daviesbacteria bacterium GW2011_GWA2_42_7]|uniref:Uncharacterized protein n=1 Tax=Candidatus Daviesbacteria bacterium GW2011_GWA2_42_7 TaxID=1618425 RepID=A0A0G1B7C6_9BACT|nr:MAG: hypothetical protein UV41_C0064G0008 [Candidatus Daviesbacteria bacterium GW2011_GWA2_42_7]